MKRRIRSKVLWGVALFIALGFALESVGQQPAAGVGGDIIRIRRMAPVKEKTPVFRTAVASQSSARQPDWWRVVVDFETAPDWLD